MEGAGYGPVSCSQLCQRKTGWGTRLRAENLLLAGLKTCTRIGQANAWCCIRNFFSSPVNVVVGGEGVEPSDSSFARCVFTMYPILSALRLVSNWKYCLLTNPPQLIGLVSACYFSRSTTEPIPHRFLLERDDGIEPSPRAWNACKQASQPKLKFFHLRSFRVGVDLLFPYGNGVGIEPTTFCLKCRCSTK